MDVTPLIKRNQSVIQAVTTDTVKISSQVYTSPVLVYPDRVVPWDVTNMDTLTHHDFAALMAQRDALDVVLLGTGSTFSMPPRAFKSALTLQGVVIEVMDNKAAARTYNVLMAENRRVVAALLVGHTGPVNFNAEQK